MKRQQPNHSRNKQRGVALILFVVLLIFGAGFFVLQSSNKDDRKNEEQTREALLKAKEALISFAVRTIYNDGTSNDLGRLPWPDRNNDTNYDGESDFSSTSLNNNLMLGRFPWRRDLIGSASNEIGVDVRDGAGERLWYAVSPNLVSIVSTVNIPPPPGPAQPQPAFNPDLVINNDHWITIVDQTGAVVQNNVAFVVIAPGSSVSGQNRNGNAPPANRYLDNVTGIEDNADNDLVFVMATKSDIFNDVMVYVTRDELIEKVNERVFNELRNRLTVYRTINGFYPYAGDTANTCVTGQLTGTLARTAGTCTAGVIAGWPPYITNNWFTDTTYIVRNDCVQTNNSGCNNPGTVVLGSGLFPQLRMTLP